ncbi:LLM class flavin-dependent oxidoreductase [Streptomyces sp. NBC_01604]
MPEVYFGGSSPIAGEFAAKHVDVYLTWGEPLAAVAEKIAWIRGLAAKEGRPLRLGIRLHVITCDTPEQAWAEAKRLLEGFDPETVRTVQAGLAHGESEGQQRILALHGGGRDRLDIHPNLWAGIGLVRGGAGTALVGSHDEVAERIKGVPRPRHRRVRALRLPALAGGVLVRRGRPATASGARAVEPSVPRRDGRTARRSDLLRGRREPATTHVIADDAEAVALAVEPAAEFAREAALRDAGCITPERWFG